MSAFLANAGSMLQRVCRAAFTFRATPLSRTFSLKIAVWCATAPALFAGLAQAQTSLTAPVTLNQKPAFDAATIATPTSGTYLIAMSGRLRGEYILSVDNPYPQTVHLLVNGNQYDNSPTIQILDNHTYQFQTMLSNFRVLLPSGNAIVTYLVMDVARAQQGTVVNIQYQGSAGYSSGLASGGATIPSGLVQVGSTVLAVNEGSVGIGTASPGAQLGVAGGAVVDQNDSNPGGLDLRFGYPSGEGIGSPRTSGAVNQWGMDFYTGGTPRVAITNGGYLGIGTRTPSQLLDVNGNIRVAGSLIFGNGTTFSPGASSTSFTGRTTFGGSNVYGTLGTVQIIDSPPVLAFHNPGQTVATIALTKEDTQHNTFKFRAGNPATDGLAGVDIEGPAYIGTGAPAGLVVTSQNLDPSLGASVTSQLNYAANNNKLLVGWNWSAGRAEQDLMAGHASIYPGGISLYDLPAGGVPKLLARFDPAGETLLTSKLHLAAADGSNNGSSIVFADTTTQTTAWTGTLDGGDYAESVDISGPRSEFEPGDLLVIDTAHHGRFLKATTAYSTLVGGVFATKPGVTGRRQPRGKSKEDEVPMAMVGIVPTKVSAENGPIHDGDLLVSSSTPGYAMKGTDRDKLTGAVLGKALGSLEAGSGVIEVLISLQ